MHLRPHRDLAQKVAGDEHVLVGALAQVTRITAQRFTEVIGEAVEDYSYTKFVYYKPLGYRGQLSRRTAGAAQYRQADGDAESRSRIGRVQATGCGTGGGARSSITMRGWWRRFTVLRRSSRFLPIRKFSTSMCAQLQASIVWMAQGRSRHLALFSYHYRVDENGKITWANLVVATGHNNNAMNKGVLQAAKCYVKDGKFSEGALNRVEAVIRTFDPCLSCSTHAFGQMPLAMTLISAACKWRSCRSSHSLSTMTA